MRWSNIFSFSSFYSNLRYGPIHDPSNFCEKLNFAKLIFPEPKKYNIFVRWSNIFSFSIIFNPLRYISIQVSLKICEKLNFAKLKFPEPKKYNKNVRWSNIFWEIKFLHKNINVFRLQLIHKTIDNQYIY